MTETAAPVVSELASNAVRHAWGPMSMASMVMECMEPAVMVPDPLCG
ncbi:hypothetical protein [Streptomyces blattellae]|nr:hypothetical protein [Streptomyces blattellae]